MYGQLHDAAARFLSLEAIGSGGGNVSQKNIFAASDAQKTCPAAHWRQGMQRISSVFYFFSDSAMRWVSCAMTSSSFVGITSVCTRAPGAVTSRSSPRILFFSTSIAAPR